MSSTSSIALAVGLLGLGYFVGEGIRDFNRAERTISVRGLAEKQVKANVAVWQLNFTVASDQITEVRTEMPKIQAVVLDFLKQKGFEDKEISKTSALRDRQAQEYGGEKGNRFVANNAIIVTTSKVDEVAKVRDSVGELVKAGVVLTREDADFYFTQLNDIKPAMLDEATRNARDAANGFAQSMNVKVGKLKSASQGVFSIESPISGGDSEYGSSNNSSLFKKVRVVTQVEFYINE